MLEFLEAKGTVTDKAKFISFITGYSDKKIRQLLPKVLERANDSWTEFESDISEVKRHFEALKLTEISKMIDNEISEIAKNL